MNTKHKSNKSQQLCHLDIILLQGITSFNYRWVSILRFSKQTQYKVKHTVKRKLNGKSKPQHKNT